MNPPVALLRVLRFEGVRDRPPVVVWSLDGEFSLWSRHETSAFVVAEPASRGDRTSTRVEGV